MLIHDLDTTFQTFFDKALYNPLLGTHGFTYAYDYLYFKNRFFS